MGAISNFDLIKPLLSFSSKDDFYFLQILQRKKDHEEGKVNGTNNNSRLIKPYYINSLEYFEFITPEVIQLCEIFNARAGINLNRRSFRDMSLQHLKKITDQIINRDYHKAYKAYSSVVGAYSSETDKKWILDIDDMNIDIPGLMETIAPIEPVGDKVIAIIPSKSGLHIIVKPFNIKRFETYHNFHKIEIHKNNPTNLYIP